MAGGDLTKMDEITELSIYSCLNWLSYTKDVELEQERNTKT